MLRDEFEIAMVLFDCRTPTEIDSQCLWQEQ
jgi:hypothetical protein